MERLFEETTKITNQIVMKVCYQKLPNTNISNTNFKVFMIGLLIENTALI